MKKTLLMMATILLFSSCAKEEFSANKGVQNTSLSPLDSSSNKLCSQSTLISPKVDILMLWDNSTSFNIVNSQTRQSMGQLIKSVSENFDYHILSVPLISSDSNTLYQAQLVAKNNTGLNSSALGILKDKETAASSLSFTLSSASAEPGVDRAINIIDKNIANGIFRKDAYTIVVVISNEDDDSCESSTGYISCAKGNWEPLMQAKINKLLCMRGNTYANCSGTGYSAANSLNSTMMRFINISPLTSCTTGNGKINYRYRMVANALYSAQYSNGWPTSNDHISPDVSGAFDSYNLCSINFSHIFDGVNSAIKQTLLRHKYNYWPVAGSSTSIDPSTIRVIRSDGKELTNRTGEPNPADGFSFDNIASTRNTRFFPTAGEPFTGKMIQLHGVDGNDLIVYPDCLTVKFNAEKSTYGYIYLQYGEPNVDTIEVKVNGSVVPKSATNGWDYMGLQYAGALDQNLKVANMPSGTNSGYFLRLNGSYKIQNTSANSITVLYRSKSQ